MHVACLKVLEKERDPHTIPGDFRDWDKDHANLNAQLDMLIYTLDPDGQAPPPSLYPNWS